MTCVRQRWTQIKDLSDRFCLLAIYLWLRYTSMAEIYDLWWVTCMRLRLYIYGYVYGWVIRLLFDYISMDGKWHTFMVELCVYGWVKCLWLSYTSMVELYVYGWVVCLWLSYMFMVELYVYGRVICIWLSYISMVELFVYDWVICLWLSCMPMVELYVYDSICLAEVYKEKYFSALWLYRVLLSIRCLLWSAPDRNPWLV